jgi:hypothetical protein
MTKPNFMLKKHDFYHTINDINKALKKNPQMCINFKNRNLHLHTFDLTQNYI